MRIPSEIETNAIALLTELERSIVKGYRVSNSVVLAMNELKKAIDKDEKLLAKELEDLYNQVKQEQK